MNTVVLPGGNLRVFGLVLAPYRRHSFEVLRRARRRRGGEVGARHPRLLEESLEARRGDEQPRPDWLRRRVPPGVQRPLGDVEYRSRVRREGALAVQGHQLPLQEAIGLVHAVMDVRRRPAPRQASYFHQRECSSVIVARRLERNQFAVSYPDRSAFARRYVRGAHGGPSSPFHIQDIPSQQTVGSLTLRPRDTPYTPISENTSYLHAVL